MFRGAVPVRPVDKRGRETLFVAQILPKTYPNDEGRRIDQGQAADAMLMGDGRVTTKTAGHRPVVVRFSGQRGNRTPTARGG